MNSVPKPGKSQRKFQSKPLTKEEIERKIVREIEQEKVLERLLRKRPRTLGQKAADWMTRWVGSWTFIFLLSIFMATWMAMNVYMVVYRWDPYPFILLNFVLSCLAAVQAPIILMSQNREAERDRIRAEHDYRVNRKAELEIEDIQRDLEIIKQMIREMRK